MSSALKPVLTPSGAQNSSVPPQLNKPMHPQGASATYGQSMSHLPQNLVNIPHNPPNSANLHNPAHSVSNHNANHYSLNVPNASQHYTTVSGVTPNSNTNQTVSPPKTSTFNPTFQQSIGNSYKTPSVSTPTSPPPQTPTNLPSPPQPQNVSSSTTDTTTAEKPQSNGTQESKDSNNSEVPQNYSMSQAVKEKVETPQCTTVLPEKSKETKEEVVSTPIVISSASEPKTNTDVNKSPPEVITSSPSTDKNCTPTDSTSLVNNVTESLPAITTTTATTTTTVNSTTVNSTTVNSTTVSPTQANQPTPTSSLPTESAATQESATPTTTTATKPKEQASQKSPVKLAATPRTPTRKPKSPKLETPYSSKCPKSVVSEVKPANQKSPGSTGKAKRNRIKTQPYQCPLPEVELVSKISVTTPKTKNSEDKLIIFYKNEFLAVRNSEGGFYICQAVQNIYKSSPRIRIRWLSQDKNDKEAYSPDFYDYTDFDCILTNLNLSRMDKGKYRLPANERIRTDSILKRALAVEQGDATPPSLTEEHPDGLDLSLYKEESQLKKRKSLKRKSTSPLKSSPSSSTSSSKTPDQTKVRKVATKSKLLPVKKSTVLKRALSVKTKKIAASTRAERASKRKLEVTTVSPKTSPVIDHKKAKVLAKVARRAAVAPPKVQAPPKQILKANKQVASTSKKTVPVTKKEKPVAVTRKSKRGKK